MKQIFTPKILKKSPPITTIVEVEIQPPAEFFHKLNELWDTEIKQLECFFKSYSDFPSPIKLDQCTLITNVPEFSNRHLIIIKANNGNKTFLPYLQRLQSLKSILTNKTLQPCPTSK